MNKTKYNHKSVSWAFYTPLLFRVKAHLLFTAMWCIAPRVTFERFYTYTETSI